MQTKTIKIQCPAKINLTLKVINKREDGFHNIESIMQTINLFDYLTINIENSTDNDIILTGNSTEIPYDKTNLVYKAAQLFIETCNVQNYKVSIFIEKNIPIAAGLAGGSTDAAGTLYGLNQLCNTPLSETELHQLCKKLGSDLNVCLTGGKLQTKGRGEIIEPLEFEEFNLHLIKPKDLGISAKEAYTTFAQNIIDKKSGRDNFINDLEWAVIDNYPELQTIKTNYPKATMTGSGSTYYSLDKEFKNLADYWVKNNLKSIPYGVKEVE